MTKSLCANTVTIQCVLCGENNSKPKTLNIYYIRDERYGLKYLVSILDTNDTYHCVYVFFSYNSYESLISVMLKIINVIISHQ